MTDFIGAFEQGLEAAEAADRAREEVKKVFTELNSQIYKASGGKINIEIREYEVTKSALGWQIVSPFSITPKETYLAIIAFNPTVEKSSVKELARWSQDRAGYPCTIDWGKNRVVCEDKKGLETALATLLKDPLVGERLTILMSLGKTTLKEESGQQEDKTDKE